MRAPKIKVSKIDLKTFLLENIEIDTFWDDLIAQGDISYKKEKRKKHT
jgi:hypothetical protein